MYLGKMKRVIFLHPDLGIGGAERAMIDAGLALQSLDYCVHFVTSHHDPGHCFTETKDGTLHITSVGDWLPRSLAGRCYALCAYIRMIYAAIYLVFFSGLHYNIVICDQISAAIPVLRLSQAKIIFYCHFPDMLLTQRQNFLKWLYRAPLDWLEEKTTGLAHTVLVNSQFTAEVFQKTFTSLTDVHPQVLYPIPDFASFDKPIDEPSDDLIPKNMNTVFLSINRYERKKNLALAIEALGMVREKITNMSGLHLIMAGGYDERVTENKEHYLELRQLAIKLGLEDHVTFLRSFSDSQKRILLTHSTCLIYTPDKEHFGIVPIEAMYMRCPVIAVRSGGPLETVDDKSTGFHCDPTPGSFAVAMLKFTSDLDLSKKMGQNGRKRVIEKFSFKAFTNQLDSVINRLSDEKEIEGSLTNVPVLWIVMFFVTIIVAFLLTFS